MDFESILNSLDLSSGKHKKEDGLVCAIEAYNKARGFDFSDHAPDVCPALQGDIRAWNDNLPSNAERNRILRPLLPLLKDTKGSDRLALRRVFMLQDWEIRVRVPAFLRLVKLEKEAEALESLPEIINLFTLKEAEKACSAACSAAYSAADSAARSAARSAGPQPDYLALFSATVDHCQTTHIALIRKMCAMKETDIQPGWTWD